MKPPRLMALLALGLVSAPAGAQRNTRPDSAAMRLIVPPRTVPAYRNRIIGVWDAETYQPLAGAEVSDLLAGTSSLTSGTGNVSLIFLPEGTSLVRIRKLGYESQTFPVTIAPPDSSPITIILSHMTQLAPVVTAADRSHRRGPADTVLALERNGFYERRNSGVAPASAYLTEEKIKGLTLLSDSRYLTGRSICTGNVYIDGAKVSVPSSQIGRGCVARNLKQGIDAVISDPTTVLALETYKWDEMPAQFGATFTGPGALNGGGDGCVTLIWTKF